ncbi:hypothetical protein FHS61_002971 [Altererythrobacter atlanticus]|uniref:Uncharacterized protein n=1 Tax=Croceibacterium atlanticum TaxID=1267766 RepID=A0A0F7KXE8_9SPHN|nr:hypothetical protein WYH_03340 [Croceibacterium atlanticum]MBB5733924.1 hypothetical protein [Croceibacterium atlanticum]
MRDMKDMQYAGERDALACDGRLRTAGKLP